jgi:hypothetical protein
MLLLPAAAQPSGSDSTLRACSRLFAQLSGDAILASIETAQVELSCFGKLPAGVT